MPEISFFIFDLTQIFKLFPKVDSEYNKKIREYEEKLEQDMAQNRMRLFAQ